MRSQEQLTDCEDALREYDSLWSGTRRVLCVEGTSGIGKSTLIRFLVQCHETRRSCALLDLAEIPLTRADIVGVLTDQLADPAGLSGSVRVRTSAGLFGRVISSPVVVAIGAEPELSPLSGLDYLRSHEWVPFHTRALRVFDKRGAPLDVLYHALSADPNAGIDAWVQAFDQAAEAERVALARLLRLPEIWAWLPPPGKAAWQARVKGLIGLGSALDAVDLGSDMAVQQAIQQHEQTHTTVLTPTDLDARRPRGAR